MMRLSTGLLFLLSWLALSTPSFAIDPAGSAVAVNPQATGALDGATAKTLITGDDVFLGQRVVTGNAGEVQIVFSDDTHLVVGPNATLVIAEYLMRNDTTASKVVINALGGTFRFITGNSPKNAYQINTPTGTMGVRGTEFDFTVKRKDSEGPAETAVLLYHGAVRLCGLDETCKILNDVCDVGVTSTADPTTVLTPKDRRRSPYIPGFPYLEDQASLLTDFQLTGTKGCKGIKTTILPDGKIASIPGEPPVTEPDPEPDPDPTTDPTPEQHDNNGGGNGGEGDEGDTETGNPGHGNNSNNSNSGNNGNNGNHNGQNKT